MKWFSFHFSFLVLVAATKDIQGACVPVIVFNKCWEWDCFRFLLIFFFVSFFLSLLHRCCHCSKSVVRNVCYTYCSKSPHIQWIWVCCSLRIWEFFFFQFVCCWLYRHFGMRKGLFHQNSCCGFFFGCCWLFFVLVFEIELMHIVQLHKHVACNMRSICG